MYEGNQCFHKHLPPLQAQSRSPLKRTSFRDIVRNMPAHTLCKPITQHDQASSLGTAKERGIEGGLETPSAETWTQIPGILARHGDSCRDSHSTEAPGES
ncbi:hypothetical protein DPMN_026234 [Dreissena polymorpha]|uniref:Uncharacterized protein n=1 Tax=Dreissena polymorpha TaxID=45954 RepID=A0A9D4LT20_DREPO|nr:hypothetical protein DPMN_026234 [Dreissena polymorpha]